MNPELRTSSDSCTRSYYTEITTERSVYTDCFDRIPLYNS